MEALLSVRPHYAERILSKTKTVEIRRTHANLRSGDVLWLYATLPIGRIIGFARVVRVTRGNASSLWHAHGAATDIARGEFFSYLDGVREGTAICLERPVATASLTLNQMAQIRPNFHPPRVLTWLTDDESQRLRSLCPPYA